MEIFKIGQVLYRLRFFLHYAKKKSSEFWSTNYGYLMVESYLLKSNFLEKPYFGPLAVLPPNSYIC